MIKIVIISLQIAACAVAGWMAGGVAAKAAETVTYTRTVYSLDDFPKLRDSAKALCGSTTVKLSDGAKAACAGSKPWPGVTKAGAFRNAGVGAEFNTLLRQ